LSLVYTSSCRNENLDKVFSFWHAN